MTSRDASLWALVIGQLVAVAAGVASAAYGQWLWLFLLGVVAVGLTAAAWRRGGRNFATSSTVTPNILLIALPTVLASSSISVVIGFGGCVVIAVASLWAWPPHPKVALTWPCAILPAIALAIVLRPNYPGTVYSAAFAVAGSVAIALVVMLSTSSSSALISLIDGLGVFTVASVLLWLVGLTARADRTAGLENSLTGGDRVIFPLSTSLAATPSMAAIYLVAVVPVLIIYPRHRLLRMTAIPFAVAILVLSDSRISIVGAAALCVCILLAPKPFRVAAPWFVGLAAITPFIYGYLQAAVAAASTYVPWLARADEQAGSLARRDYIWSQSLEYYLTQIDWFHQTFGYGSFGHVASGASGYYAARYQGLGSDARLVTPHNTMLQVLFDGGWLAATALAVTMVVLAWKISRRPSPIYVAALAMLVALSIVGITEVALSPSHAHAQPTWWVLVILGMIVFAEDRSTPDDAADNSTQQLTTTPVPASEIRIG